MPAMLIYSIFMLVESTIMLNTMLTVVAKKKSQHLFLVYQWPLLIWALTVTLSLDIELARSASVDLESANVTSSGERSPLDVLKPASKSDLAV